MFGLANVVGCSAPASLTASRQRGSSQQRTGRSSLAICCVSADDNKQNATGTDRAAQAISRRALLGVVGVALASPSAPANAEGVLDAILNAKKVNNAKFLVGPVRISRFRAGEAEKLLNTANFGGARDKLQDAALDCLKISLPNLEAYSKYRDVCTFKIVGRSVLEGPAGRHTPDEPIYQETAGALKTLISDYEAVDISLEEKNADAARKGFKSLFASLDRYEAALFAAIGVDPTLPQLADIRSAPAS